MKSVGSFVREYVAVFGEGDPHKEAVCKAELANELHLTKKQVDAMCAWIKIYKGRESTSNIVHIEKKEKYPAVSGVDGVADPIIAELGDASIYDNEVKEKWRNTIAMVVREYLHTAQRSKGKVLCLPGDTLNEIEMYIELGFRREHIYALERDKEVHEKNEEIFTRLGINYLNIDLLSFLGAEGATVDFSIVSMDMLGPFCGEYARILSRIRTHRRSIVILNVQAKRESKEAQRWLCSQASLELAMTSSRIETIPIRREPDEITKMLFATMPISETRDSFFGEIARLIITETSSNNEHCSKDIWYLEMMGGLWRKEMGGGVCNYKAILACLGVYVYSIYYHNIIVYLEGERRYYSTAPSRRKVSPGSVEKYRSIFFQEMVFTLTMYMMSLFRAHKIMYAQGVRYRNPLKGTPMSSIELVMDHDAIPQEYRATRSFRFIDAIFSSIFARIRKEGGGGGPLIPEGLLHIQEYWQDGFRILSKLECNLFEKTFGHFTLHRDLLGPQEKELGSARLKNMRADDIITFHCTGKRALSIRVGAIEGDLERIINNYSKTERKNKAVIEKIRIIDID